MESDNNRRPRLIVHGGAGNWTGRDEETVLAGVKAAATAGWRVLTAGGSALDTVEAAVMMLEDHPSFDAGVGSYLNDCGEVEMDALITDGCQLDFGAVAAVRRVANPIRLARLVMTKTKYRLFVAEGADRLAGQLGLPPIANLALVTETEFADFQQRVKTAAAPGAGLGTVGAVAVDQSGHIASATSTGGSPHKPKGRVGDVPVYGAGGYADDHSGGASATGVGENIMRCFLSKHVVDLIAAGKSPRVAAQDGVTFVANRIPNPEVGIITLDQCGNVGAAHTTNGMPVAWIDAEGNLRAGMRAPYTW